MSESGCRRVVANPATEAAPRRGILHYANCASGRPVEGIQEHGIRTGFANDRPLSSGHPPIREKEECLGKIRTSVSLARPERERASSLVDVRGLPQSAFRISPGTIF